MDNLKQVIDQKNLESVESKGVVFHQDNARPHASLPPPPAEVIEAWLGLGIAFIRTKSDPRRYSQRKHRAETAADYHYLQLTATKNKTALPTHLRSFLLAATGRLVSISTVRRRLHRRRVSCIQDFHQFAYPSYFATFIKGLIEHAHISFGVEVMDVFSDESRFCLLRDSRRLLVCRELETIYYTSYNHERDRFGESSPCVWEGISLSDLIDI
ncbi:hypothetical protein AVEN_63181-1 [Araneus ventricosus]|uniref:Histone-lysine N-methyltransferase SETMAR n=1 Tax=Araneus ventricosus TaxID=182803 RepID=A0A4Y2B0J4_ARAVE|nr:hypothetical protein AVEN_63181-1 [Araneus ventricosus]